MKHWRSILSWELLATKFEVGDRVKPNALYPWSTVANNALMARGFDPQDPNDTGLFQDVLEERGNAVARILYVLQPSEHAEEQPHYIASWEDDWLGMYLGHPEFSEDEIDLA